MKKTLISVAALAAALSGLATADTTWTAIDDVTATPVQEWGGGKVHTIDAYTFQFTIPEGALTSGSTVLAYINGNLPGDITSDDNRNRQFTYVLSVGTNNTYTLQMGRSNLTEDASAINWHDNMKSVDNALHTGIVYTVTSTGGNNPTVVVSWPGDPGNKYTRHPSDTGQLVFDSNATAPTAMINSTYAVPEPATATLSLLALAGLAARRRRK